LSVIERPGLEHLRHGCQTVGFEAGQEPVRGGVAARIVRLDCQGALQRGDGAHVSVDEQRRIESLLEIKSCAGE